MTTRPLPKPVKPNVKHQHEQYGTLTAVATICITGTLLFSWSVPQHSWQAVICALLMLASVLYLASSTHAITPSTARTWNKRLPTSDSPTNKPN